MSLEGFFFLQSGKWGLPPLDLEVSPVLHKWADKDRVLPYAYFYPLVLILGDNDGIFTQNAINCCNISFVHGCKPFEKIQSTSSMNFMTVMH